MARYKRITKKKKVDAPDEFISFWGHAITWIGENKNKVIFPVIGVVAIALIVVMAFFYNNQKEQTASTELAFILNDFPRQAGADAQKMARELNEFSERHSGATSGRIGILYNAHALYIDKDLEGAANVYRKVIGQNPGDLLSRLAAIGLATSLEESGKYAEAIETLKKLRVDKENPFLEMTDMAIARNYALNNDKSSALNEYQYFLTQHPSSPLAATVEERMDALQ